MFVVLLEKAIGRRGQRHGRAVFIHEYFRAEKSVATADECRLVE
jgi:hypothetical protein